MITSRIFWTSNPLLSLAAVTALLVFTACNESSGGGEQNQGEEPTAEIDESGAKISLEDGSEASFPPGAVAVGSQVSFSEAQIPDEFTEMGINAVSKALEVAATKDGVSLEFATSPYSLAISLPDGESSESAALQTEFPNYCIIGKSKSLPIFSYPRSRFKIEESNGRMRATFKARIFGLFLVADCSKATSIADAVLVNESGRALKASLEYSVVSVEAETVVVGDEVKVTLATMGLDQSPLGVDSALISPSVEPADAGAFTEAELDADEGKYVYILKAKKVADKAAVGFSIGGEAVLGTKALIITAAAPTVTPEDSCRSGGQHWYQAACHSDPITCSLSSGKVVVDAENCRDASTTELTTEAGCQSIGGHWYSSTCNENAPPFGTLAATIIGDTASAYFGSFLTMADVNNDGKADIVTGEPYMNTNTGRIRAFNAADQSAIAHLEIAGENANDRFGETCLAGLHWDDDGHEDVLAVSWLFNSGDGKVYVFSGADGSILWSRVGTLSGGQFGISCAAFDVDGDTIDDLVIGSGGSGAQKVFVFKGRDASTTPIRTYSGGGYFGRSVASAGDFNNDGTLDIAVGENTAQVLHILNGASDSVNVSLNTQAGFNDAREYNVRGIGDLNGDGYDDVAYGSAMATPPIVQVISGSDGSVIWSRSGTNGSRFGWAIETTGDRNGDGVNDLIVGAPYGDVGGTDYGEVYVFSGSDPAAAPLETYIGEGTSHFFGEALVTGDFDGDGDLEFATGARGHSSIMGKVYIYH